MASVEVYDTIKGYLQAQFSPTPVHDFDEIDVAQQQSQVPFLILEETGEDEQLIGFGDPASLCNRQSGILIVRYMAPSPQSSGVARAGAQSVQEALRHQHLSGVRVISVSPPDFQTMNDGLWTVAATVVEYQYDLHAAAQ